MKSKKTSHTEIRSLGPGEANFTAEAERIQRLALSSQCHVVRLGPIVFFSTQTGDAWMLDSDDHCAVCLARDFELLSIPIKESRERLAIEWNADYEITGLAFTVAERTGNVRTILGYPTAEIQRLLNQFPARPEDFRPDVSTSLARLNTGRNEACPCGSGKKYKKCCLDKDQEVARKLGSSGTGARNPERTEVAVDPIIGADEIAAEAVGGEPGESELEEEPEPFSEVDAGAERDPALSEEENQIVTAWWDRVRGPYLEEPNGGEALRQLTEFLDEHPRLFPHLHVEDELLLQLERMLGLEGRNADYIAILQRLRREQPEAYQRSSGWFDYALIADAVARGARGEIPCYFSFFRQEFEDAFDHLGRVFDLLAWTGCDAELFQLAGDTARIDPEDGEWPWHASARWLCVREAIPFVQSAAESRSDAQHLLEAQRKALGLAPHVPADVEFVHDQLQCIAHDPMTWKLPSLPGREGIGFTRVAWNFSGWLARQHGCVCVKATFVSRLLWQYWAWPAHRGAARNPFHLDPESLEGYLDSQLAGDEWPICATPFAFLQAVVWFGEYLVARADWKETGLAALRQTAARLYADLHDQRLSSDVALRLYADFAALIS